MPNADAEAARARRLLGAWVVLAVVVLDQATKIWAAADLASHPVSIVGSDVELRLSRNAGGAFGVLGDFTPLLVVFALAIAVVLVRAVQRADSTLVVVGLALVLGGAVGNLADRLVRSPGFGRGEVVDFVKVGSWPTFNVADSAITIGAIVLVVSLFTRSRAAGARKPNSPDEPTS